MSSASSLTPLSSHRGHRRAAPAPGTSRRSLRSGVAAIWESHAMDIDKQRIAAVQALEALGYKYQDGEWLPWPSALRWLPALMPGIRPSAPDHGRCILW